MGYPTGGVAFAPDGRVWVAVGHGDGTAGGIHVIAPGVQGTPVDTTSSQPSAADVVSTMPALAQENVAVTATQACEWLHSGGAAKCTSTASDPRVTGPLTLEEPSWTHVLVPRLDAGALVWFDATLQGPEGTWSGSVGVVNESEGVAHLLMVLAGDGVYEGWTYIAAGSASEPGDYFDYVFQDLIDTVGVLCQGPPPSFGPPPPMPPTNEQPRITRASGGARWSCCSRIGCALSGTGDDSAYGGNAA